MLSYTDEMTFLERLNNVAAFVFDAALRHCYHWPNQRKIYQKYFPNAKKSLDEISKSSAIVFVNDHVSSSTARPYLPNVIEIGGIHIEPSKKLPEDLKRFLDSATKGVILFSMGSIVQAVDWPLDKREALVKAFGKIKQKVLWKYENETLPNKPDNVMISPWIPQRDILAHPNVKLFITHGGLLGTSEALTEGVPVLGFPIYGDQMMNMAKAVSRGYGLKIGIEEISEESVSRALNELLSNSKYLENAKTISKKFTDRPMTPQGTVIYWTDYAYRHKGAPHLQAAAKSLSFIEFYLVDVYVTLAVIGFLFFFIDYLALKFLVRKFMKKPVKATTSLKKKKN